MLSILTLLDKTAQISEFNKSQPSCFILARSADNLLRINTDVDLSQKIKEIKIRISAEKDNIDIISSTEDDSELILFDAFDESLQEVKN